MGGCSEPVVHIFKIIFIILLLATGIAFIAAGAYVNSDENSYIDLTSSKINQVAILFIVVGSFVIAVSLLGCFWIFKKVDYALYAYLIILSVLCIMEFSGGIAALVYHDDVPDQVKNHLDNTIDQYDDSIKNDIYHQWNYMQSNLQCCGTYNYSSWASNTNYQDTTLPSSCCYDQTACTTDDPSNIHPTGCISEATDDLQHNANILGGTGIGLAIVQLLGVLVTGIEVMLARCLRKICCCCCNDD